MIKGATILLWATQLLFIPLFSPFVIGVTRKIKARFQNRRGAPLFQPYRDVWKLFHKDEVVSDDASWVFLAAPYVIFATTLLIAVNIPLAALSLHTEYSGDMLLFVYLIALGTFFLALAGMDTGGAFGGFGSSREMLLASLTEGGLVLSLFTLALISRSSNLFSISKAIADIPVFHSASILLAFISFSIAMLAETCRYPFDNPATHLELTMIHEAMILEYSGKRLALIEWASANKLLIFLSLGANLFFPWGISDSTSAIAILTATGALMLKVLILAAAIAVIESTIAKYRIFRLPDLLFTSFIISIIAIGLIN